MTWLAGKRVRWIATGAAAALCSAWVAGRWWSATAALGRNAVGVSHGCLYANRFKGMADPDRRELSLGLNEPYSWAWWGAAKDDTRYRGASVPLWALAVPMTVVAAGSWRGPVLAELRRRKGRCPECGYDRAGLAVCPECGEKWNFEPSPRA